MSEPMPNRRFMLKKKYTNHGVSWLAKNTIYDGQLISMTNRVVRLFSPGPAEERRFVDLSYDWVTPVR